MFSLFVAAVIAALISAKPRKNAKVSATAKVTNGAVTLSSGFFGAVGG